MAGGPGKTQWMESTSSTSSAGRIGPKSRAVGVTGHRQRGGRWGRRQWMESTPSTVWVALAGHAATLRRACVRIGRRRRALAPSPSSSGLTGGSDVGRGCAFGTALRP